VEYGFVDLMVYAGKVGGTCSIECLGNVEGRPSFQFDLTGGRIEKHFGTDSAAVISLNGSQEAFYDETASTLFIPGGTFSGMASDSMEYLAVVDDYYPFIKERDCTYIRDGIFSYTVKNAAGAEIGNGVVDFGYVDPIICDKYAIVVVDGDGYRSEYYYIMGW
jgi:hypothetical protein